ncbi:hypothetical protein RND81_13G077600 [Saponaria officinalis]|uniref:Uncharacterized protein n=1 Tax=Saponaria officinalis TaxID=3572 RepID=A0AAW1GXX9_SAPOF
MLFVVNNSNRVKSLINYLTINPRKTSQIPNSFPQFRSSSTSRSNQSTVSDAFPSGRFDFDDDFRREKRWNWWSDDEDDDNDDEDDYDYDDDDDDDEFVFWEEPNPIDWIFKVGAWSRKLKTVMLVRF